MKNIIDYISEHKITESNIDMDELFNSVEYWFDWHCRKDAYDSNSEWRKDLKYISKKENDFATSECIDYLSDDYDNVEDYYDEIEDKLAELAKEALDND